MKSVLLAIILTIFTVFCLAQADNKKSLIPYEIDEKWGYINNNGKIVIQPQYDDANYFYEGLAVVCINHKYGFIDETGKFIIQPQYGDAFEFSEGLAPVAKDKEGLWEYINHQGNTVIEPKFALAHNFSEGLAPVLVGDAPNVRHGYIDKTGNFAIQPQFGWTESFSDGLAVIATLERETNLIQLYNSKAFIDKTGRRVTPFFTSAQNFSEGLAGVKINELWGVIDTSGALVISPQFDYVGEFSEGFAVYGCGKKKYGYIDKNGNKLTDCIFIEAKDFKEGLAPIQDENEKWGYIDASGKFVIKPKFEEAETFYNGLARVEIRQDNKIYQGFINTKGEILIKNLLKDN